MKNKEIYEKYQNIIYDIIIKNRVYLSKSSFDNKNIEQLIKLLATNGQNDLSELLNDKYLKQNINNVLSKMYLENKLFRIQKGTYSFSSNIIDFKMKLDESLDKFLIKDRVFEKMTINSEASFLDHEVYIPKKIVDDNFIGDEKDKKIFLKKFKQYKIINLPENYYNFIHLISLLKFYRKNNINALEYIKTSKLILKNENFNSEEFLNYILKLNTKEDFLKYNNVKKFMKALSKEY
ncbi:MAG: hypothetical protein ACRCRZ_02180 [Metamycoplasmataceae bacterium]